MKREAIVFILLISAFLVIGCTENNSDKDASITILSPTEGDMVSSLNTVEGTSINVYGSNLNIYVLVCPIEYPEWWVQPDVSISQNGNWSTKAFFGDQANLQKDSWKKFAITVIVTSTKLKRGQVLESIPENVYQVDIKEVVRK